MLQMGVQVTHAWLGPLRVLSSALIAGVARLNVNATCMQLKNTCIDVGTVCPASTCAPTARSCFARASTPTCSNTIKHNGETRPWLDRALFRSWPVHAKFTPSWLSRPAKTARGPHPIRGVSCRVPSQGRLPVFSARQRARDRGRHLQTLSSGRAGLHRRLSPISISISIGTPVSAHVDLRQHQSSG